MKQPNTIHKTYKIIFLFAILIGIYTSIFTQNSFRTFPDTLNKKRLFTTIEIEMGAYVTGMAGLGLIWYKDQERVPFHWYDDSKGYLQMDKAGHAYAAFKESQAAYYALRAAGVDKKKALLYGGPIGLLFQTPIEIFDGLYEGWGFSWYDMAANAAGSGLFIANEAIFDEQVFLMKFSYSPSIYPSYHSHLGTTHIERFFLDYNGHTYWLSGNLQRLTGAKKIPSWLNLAFGYSANGMIYEFRNPRFYQGQPFPHLERYRQYLFSLDVDWTRIPTKRKSVRFLLHALNCLKFPFPALEYNRVDGVRFRGMYF